MGRNIRLMQSRFKMEERNVLTFWNHKCDNKSHVAGYIAQDRELCEWRDKCDNDECKTIIDFLCTD